MLDPSAPQAPVSLAGSPARRRREQLFRGVFLAAALTSVAVTVSPASSATSVKRPVPAPTSTMLALRRSPGSIAEKSS